MKSLEELLSELAENADLGILSPKTVEHLKERGIHLSQPPKRSLEDSIELIFSNEHKKRALEVARKLPEPPEITVPSIQSLYNEIREAIILGLNGAAITLSGILVEYVLKYSIYKTEIGGFAKYDPDKADEFERLTLGPTIDRAAKAGLLERKHVDQLRLFKDRYRNPYNHYNIKKITANYYIPVSILNTETNEVETRDIAAKDDPVIQAQAKPYVDADNVFEAFIFADSVVRYLWNKISYLQQTPVSSGRQVKEGEQNEALFKQRRDVVQEIDELRERLFSKYGEMPDSVELIRQDRAR